ATAQRADDRRGARGRDRGARARMAADEAQPDRRGPDRHRRRHARRLRARAMDATLKLWAVIAIVGALNYLSRLSFIALFARRHVPPLAVRAFRYVPAAMLTALVLPMVVGAPLEPAGVALPKAVAAVAAGAVAFATRSTLATLAAGMLVLWGLEA